MLFLYMLAITQEVNLGLVYHWSCGSALPPCKYKENGRRRKMRKREEDEEDEKDEEDEEEED